MQPVALMPPRLTNRLGLLVALVALAGVGLAIYPLTLMDGQRPRHLRESASTDSVNPATGGALSVTSSPAGAAVMLNNRFVGMTPLHIDSMQPGRHLLRLDKQGFRTHRETVTIGDAETAVAIDLAAQPTGVLLVVTEPAGAEVVLDGKRLGLSPLRIPDVEVGEHDVLLQLVNHEDDDTVAHVAAGERTTLHRKLVNRHEQFYLNAIAQTPRRISLYTDLGHYYYVNGDMDKAIYYFSRGLELCYQPNADHHESRRHKKEIKKHMGWDMPGRQRFRTTLEGLHARLKRKRPVDAESTRRQAAELLQDGELAQALKTLKEGLTVAPRNSRLLLMLGEIQLRRNQAREALKVMQQAVNNAPRDVFVRMEIARNCTDHGGALPTQEQARVLRFATGQLTSALAFTPAGEMRPTLLTQRARVQHLLSDLSRGNPTSADRHLQSALDDLTAAVACSTKRDQRLRVMSELAELLEDTQPDRARGLYREIVVDEQTDSAVRQRAREALERLDGDM